MFLTAQLTILIVLINYIHFFFAKYILKKSNPKVLFCGLIAYCGDTPPNMDKVNILGIYNEERGKDSCGIAYNDSVYKGIGDEAKWSKFAQKMEYEPLTSSDNYTIIGHTRKSTMGSNSKENAHPFEIYETDNDTDPKLIFAHNGQILNYRDLARDYDVDLKNINVDSLAFGTILAKDKKNLKVFSEYKGYGAFLFYPVGKKNTLYIFKGKSKKYPSSASPEEERPLFYWKVPGKNQIYISSIADALYSIGGDKKSVFSFECNKLIMIQNGKFINLKAKIANYDRSAVVAETYSSSSSSYLDGADNWVDERVSSCCSGGTQLKTPFTTNSGKSTPSAGSIETTISKVLNNKPSTTIGKWAFNNVKLDEENKKAIYNPSIMGDQVYFWQGRYHRNGHMLGKNNEIAKLFLDDNGRSVDSETKGSWYYFINGLLCKNKIDADVLKAEFDKGPEKSYCYVKMKYDNQVYHILNSGFICKYIRGFVHAPLSKYPDAHDGLSMRRAHGDIFPMFSNMIYTFKDGELVKITVKDIKLAEEIFNGKKKEEPKNLPIFDQSTSQIDVEADMNATWAPNVPQEEPVINKDIEIVEDEQEYTDKEEEAIDVLLDTMNEIQHNIKKLNPVTDDEKKGIIGKIKARLNVTWGFLNGWYNNQSEGTDLQDEEDTVEKADEKDNVDPIEKQILY